MLLVAYPVNFWTTGVDYKICSWRTFCKSPERLAEYHATDGTAITGNPSFVIERLAARLAEKAGVDVSISGHSANSKFWIKFETEFWQARQKARGQWKRQHCTPAGGAFIPEKWANGVFMFWAWDAVNDEWRRVALYHPTTANGKAAKKWKACAMYGIPRQDHTLDKWFDSTGQAAAFFENEPEAASQMWQSEYWQEYR